MPLPALLRPLRDPALALLWGGLATSAVGDQLFAVALAWTAVGVLGSAAGYLTALQAAAILATALAGGHWADRQAHRRLMILADLARAAVLAAVAGIWLWRGTPPGWSLVTAVVALAAGQAFFRPALQALVPVVVRDPARLPAANALLDTTDRLARLAGPAIVGALAGTLPLAHFVSLDGATFLASAAALAGLGRLRRWPPAPHTPSPDALAAALRGFRAVRPLPLLNYMLVTAGVIFGAWFAAMFLGVPLLLNAQPRGGDAGGLGAYGLVMASYGSTNLLATFAVGSIRAVRRPARTIFAGMTLFGLGTALLGLAGLLAPPGWLLLALCAAAAFGAPGGPMEDITVAVLRQTRLPQTEQAAVMRAFMVSGQSGVLVAFTAAPAMFDALGAATGLLLCGATILIVAAAGFALHHAADV